MYNVHRIIASKRDVQKFIYIISSLKWNWNLIDNSNDLECRLRSQPILQLLLCCLLSIWIVKEHLLWISHNCNLLWIWILGKVIDYLSQLKNSTIIFQFSCQKISLKCEGQSGLNFFGNCLSTFVLFNKLFKCSRSPVHCLHRWQSCLRFWTWSVQATPEFLAK